jgi:glutamine amidotransferase-like uncharacterized protein
MIGIAVWSLVKSPEERSNRQSFLYNYGAFIAYMILAFIGILAFIEYYRTNEIIKSGLLFFFSGPAYAAGLGPLYSAFAWQLPQGAARVAKSIEDIQEDRRQSAVPIKPRRQIGYGRYHA